MAAPLFDTSTPLAPLRERLHAKLAERDPVLSREQAAEVTEAARAVSANRMR